MAVTAASTVTNISEVLSTTRMMVVPETTVASRMCLPFSTLKTAEASGSLRKKRSSSLNFCSV